MEKVRLSGREALVSIRWELKLLASKREALPAIGLKKVRLSGREAMAGKGKFVLAAMYSVFDR